ncbi:MAG: hypothetical protein Q9165_000525 [Trypethelium subeluteriae]
MGVTFDVNRNKKSLGLSFAHPTGVDIIHGLAKNSDVLVENYIPGGLKKYGLDYESLSKVNPSLIYASITGYGQTGPYNTRAGYDVMVEAKTADDGVQLTAFKTSDGDILIGGGNDRLFGVLCEKLGQPQWAQDERFTTNPLRVKHRDMLESMMEDITKLKSTTEWLTILEGSGMPYAPINDVKSTLENEHAAAVPASGASPQTPPQSKRANHGTSSQPDDSSYNTDWIDKLIIRAVKKANRDLARRANPEVKPGSKRKKELSQKEKPIPHETGLQLSASTEEIVRRVGQKPPAPDGVRETILRDMVTTQKVPSTQSPVGGSTRGGRGGSRGGKVSSIRALANGETNGSTISMPDLTPTQIGGSSRGRGSGRGRGRGGGRPRKRRRAGSEESEKPTQFSPPRPSSPSSGIKKKRAGRRVLESSVCKTCRRGYSPDSNMIVFCDGCNTAYHQYCHDPPISSEAVAIVDKEWFCVDCMRSKESSPTRDLEAFVPEAEEHVNAESPTVPTLVSGEMLSYEEKSAYFSSLPSSTLVSFLLSACDRHPDLPVFDLRVQTSAPEGVIQTQSLIQSARPNEQAPQPKGNTTASNLPSATGKSKCTADGFPHPDQNTDSAKTQPAPVDKSGRKDTTDTQAGAEVDEISDNGYESDPPAHFPKPGNGLRLPPIDNLEMVLDDNFEVFSHIYLKKSGT